MQPFRRLLALVEFARRRLISPKDWSCLRCP